jgi:hypothetical protein
VLARRCRPRQQSSFVTDSASAAAQRLAEAARKQLSLRAAQETVVLGRVRLRPLPAATNALAAGIPIRPRRLRYEQATESLAAELVQRWTGLPC